MDDASLVAAMDGFQGIDRRMQPLGEIALDGGSVLLSGGHLKASSCKDTWHDT